MPFYTVHDPIVTQLLGRHITRDSLGRLWVAYDDNRLPGPTWHIYVAYSTDGGATWTEEQVTGFPGEMNTRGCHSIAADSLGFVHIIYTDALGALRYRRRIATGWEAAENVDPMPINSLAGDIAIDANDNIHVSYTNGVDWGSLGIRYRQKLAGVWQPTEDVVLAAGQLSSAIAIDLNGGVHVTWYGAGWGAFPLESQILYRRRSAAGVWDAQELITDINLNQQNPNIIVSVDGHVHVVWQGRGWGANPGATNIRYRERDAAGWLAHTAITDVASWQNFATIGLDSSGDLFVFLYGPGWGANPANLNIQMRKRESGVWQAIQAITDRAFNQEYPSPMSALFPRTGGISGVIPITGSIIHFEGDMGTIRSEVYLDPALVFAPTEPAQVTTNPATNVQMTTATLNGTLDVDGDIACDCGFEWGESLALGNITPTTSEVAGNSFARGIAGLEPGQIYYFRAFATNLLGTAYGGTRAFTTKPSLIVVTLPATGVT